MSPDQLLSAMRHHGVLRLVAKRLAPNDNSKNQYFLGRDYSAIQLLPFGALRRDETVAAGSKKARLKAPVIFDWLTSDGGLERAEGANLILYPKYPEVRLSGILHRLRDKAPTAVVGPRASGRWLFLGVTGNGTIVAFACAHDTPCARWAEETVAGGRTTQTGVFHEFALAPADRDDVMTALRRIAARGWIDSKRLDRDGRVLPCNAQNCGGYTLEAELGIRPNGRSDPDYDGWEVKQFDTPNLARPTGGRVTLMTPEPDGGVYAEDGALEFMRRFGYADRKGTQGRINFGGMHLLGIRHDLTKLRMILTGWDAGEGKVTDVAGGLELLDPSGVIAARWSFEALLNHWKRKHAKAVYVPSNRQTDPKRRYRYGTKVFTGVGTEFTLLLAAFTRGTAFYDPASKLVTSSGTVELKRRSQFRILVRNLGSLYKNSDWVDLNETR